MDTCGAPVCWGLVTTKQLLFTSRCGGNGGQRVVVSCPLHCSRQDSFRIAVYCDIGHTRFRHQGSPCDGEGRVGRRCWEDPLTNWCSGGARRNLLDDGVHRRSNTLSFGFSSSLRQGPSAVSLDPVTLALLFAEAGQPSLCRRPSDKPGSPAHSTARTLTPCVVFVLATHQLDVNCWTIAGQFTDVP